MLFYRLFRTFFDCGAFLIGPKSPKSVNRHDIFLEPGYKIRVYCSSLKEKLPVVIYYHGGGWVIGSIKAYDPLLCFISHHAKALVIAVEYRKAPEFPFPAAIEDAYTGYQWAIEHCAEYGGDKDNISLMGDSAGGNIAAIMLNKININALCPPKHVTLIYPALDLTKENVEAIKHTRKNPLYKLGYYFFTYFLRCYLTGKEDRYSADISPCYHITPEIYTKGITLITASIDPLNPSIMAFSQALKKIDVHVDHVHYPYSFHGFLNFSGVFPPARRALNDIVERIKHD